MLIFLFSFFLSALGLLFINPISNSQALKEGEYDEIVMKPTLFIFVMLSQFSTKYILKHYLISQNVNFYCH